MPRHSDSNRTEALAFLEEIEDRHNQLLEGLDELNQQIEEVLSSQSVGRKSEVPPADE
jgi:hypothetical protein